MVCWVLSSRAAGAAFLALKGVREWTSFRVVVLVYGNVFTLSYATFSCFQGPPVFFTDGYAVEPAAVRVVSS